MKKIGIVIILFIFVWLWSPTAKANEQTVYDDMIRQNEFVELYNDLSQEMKDSLEQFGITPRSIFQGEGISFEGVKNRVVWYLQGSIKTPASAFGSVLSVMILCLLFQRLSFEKNGSMQGVLQFFVALCITVALMVPIANTINKTCIALEEMGNFMKVFIPVYAGVLLLMGKGLTVSGAGGLVFGYCQVMSYCSHHIVLPFVSMFQAFTVCEATGGGVRVNGFATCVKRTAMWIMGISATGFSGVLCLTGLINGAGDSVAQRTGRFFIGNMIPVVGGALSDTMSVLQSCFSLLKSGGGILGVAVLIVFVLPVLLEIVIWRMAIFVLVAISGVLEMPRITALLQAVGEGVVLLLGIVLCFFAVSVVCLAVLILAGG